MRTHAALDGIDAEERGRALPRCRHQPGNLDAIEPVRIALRALAPRRSRLPDGYRRDTERTVIEVEDVGVEAEGLQECGVHEPILPSRGMEPFASACAAAADPRFDNWGPARVRPRGPHVHHGVGSAVRV